MKVAVYISPLWGLAYDVVSHDKKNIVRAITGVSRHAIEITKVLADSPHINLHLLASKKSYNAIKLRLPSHLQDVPPILMPGSESLTRRVLTSVPIPVVDSFLGNIDWVYVPNEISLCTSKAKLAVTVHDIVAIDTQLPKGMPRVGWWKRVRWNWRMRRLLNRADVVFTVSEFTKTRILEQFAYPGLESRIVVVGNGVANLPAKKSDADVELLKTFGVRSDKFFLAVGGLTVRKGGDRLLKFAELLLKTKSEYKIVVCGRGHDPSVLRQLQELKDAYSEFPVVLPGFIPDEVVQQLRLNAVAMLFLSRYEGFGIPIVEAMSAGLPVICANSSSLPEVAGDAGTYVSGDSAEEIYAKVKQLAVSQDQRARMIELGKQRAKLFTWQQSGMRVIDSLLKPSK